MFAFLRACGLGILGWFTPRILIYAGVPLDKWAQQFGFWIAEKFADTQPIITEDQALTAMNIAFAIVLISAELWWKPLWRIIGVKIGGLRRSNVDPSRNSTDQHAQADSLNSLIEVSKKQDPSYAQLPLRAEIFFPRWVMRLNAMRQQRNVYDLNNLLLSSGRVFVDEAGRSRAQEVQYVLSALERNGYLQASPSDAVLRQGKELSADGNNVTIRFTEKWHALSNV